MKSVCDSCHKDRCEVELYDGIKMCGECLQEDKKCQELTDKIFASGILINTSQENMLIAMEQSTNVDIKRRGLKGFCKELGIL